MPDSTATTQINWIPLVTMLALGLGIHNGSSAQGIQFGVEAGGSYTRFQYKDKSSFTRFWDHWESKGKEAGNIMVFAILPVESIYAFQIGVRYNTIGNTLRSALNGSDTAGLPFQHSITTHYLSFPLRVRSPLVNNAWYYVLGAEFSYLISVRDDRRPSLDFPYSIIDDLSTYNISLTGGFGYLLKIDQKQIYFQGNYGHGLGNVAKPLIGGWNTQEFSISAGYLYK